MRLQNEPAQHAYMAHMPVKPDLKEDVSLRLRRTKSLCFVTQWVKSISVFELTLERGQFRLAKIFHKGRKKEDPIGEIYRGKAPFDYLLYFQKENGLRILEKTGDGTTTMDVLKTHPIVRYFCISRGGKDAALRFAKELRLKDMQNSEIDRDPVLWSYSAHHLDAVLTNREEVDRVLAVNVSRFDKQCLKGAVTSRNALQAA